MRIESISAYFNINSQKSSSYRPVVFSADRGLSYDTFERKTHPVNIRLFSPFSGSVCKSKVNLNPNQPSVFVLENSDPAENNLIVDYDPSRVGILRDKTSGNPIEVKILKSSSDNFPDSVCYHFVSKDFNREYGYVHLYKPPTENLGRNDLTKDYPEYGIVGDRVEVLYLKNYDDKHIGGIGVLADKIAVNFCEENNMEPNIISYADEWSHVAHYKRGKRFIPPKEGSDEYEFLKWIYGKTDPNDILKDLISASEKRNEDVDLYGWGYLLMYLPKDLAEKYKED